MENRGGEPDPLRESPWRAPRSADGRPARLPSRRSPRPSRSGVPAPASSRRRPTKSRYSETSISSYSGLFSGRYPIRCLAARPASARGMPSSRIDPASGSKYWVIMRMVVDFPAPLGPRKPTTCPRSTAKDTSSTAGTPLKRLETRSRESSDIGELGWVCDGRDSKTGPGTVKRRLQVAIMCPDARSPSESSQRRDDGSAWSEVPFAHANPRGARSGGHVAVPGYPRGADAPRDRAPPSGPTSATPAPTWAGPTRRRSRPGKARSPASTFTFPCLASSRLRPELSFALKGGRTETEDGSVFDIELAYLEFPMLAKVAAPIWAGSVRSSSPACAGAAHRLRLPAVPSGAAGAAGAGASG